MGFSNDKEKGSNEIREGLGTPKAVNDDNNKEKATLDMQTSRKELLNEQKNKNMYLDVLKALPPKRRFMNFNPSPSEKFRRIVSEKDEISRFVPSAQQTSSGKFHVPFVRKINWSSLKEMCKLWIRDPMNMALFVWILCVAISGAILFLVMTGMLNHVIPQKSVRNVWFEVNNQILNALFTLMCLYQHPKRLYHFVLLCRWRPYDITRLRKVYCKNGTYKPNEWAHMMLVVSLLNLNCFAQYALCGLNLGYSRSTRPPIGVAICISVAIASPAIASVYSILSPLGKEYDTETDLEAQGQVTCTEDHRPSNNLRLKSLEKQYSFIRDDQRTLETAPRWIGGLFDIWDDISTAYLSIFCSCFVFGWNMQRLGFGNMYVHIATFLLFCLAPFFIFNLAAVNIESESVREALGITGFFLCIFGLLYGGFWRIQMRKRFNLPGNTLCCGNASVTDCLGWLFCCSCSLAQEVRTADFYDVVEDKLYEKENFVEAQLALTPLPGEMSSPLITNETLGKSDGSSVMPPAPVVIQKEDDLATR